MQIDGGCHCGFIRYEAEIDADRVIICHCTDCQKLSGSAFRVVVPARPGTFKLLSGSPKIYLKVAESGAGREQGFCPECGTPIFSQPTAQDEAVVALRVGTIRQRNNLAPRDQYWARSSQSWLLDLPNIHKWERQPVFRVDGGFQE